MSQDDQQTRPFADWLREQGRGRLHDELTEKLNELAIHQKTGRQVLNGVPATNRVGSSARS